jgi:hypothetical protein
MKLRFTNGGRYGGKREQNGADNEPPTHFHRNRCSERQVEVSGNGSAFSITISS